MVTIIDIIITVYNTPIGDLKRCLESIKKQTYKNWSAYIINDGSEKDVRTWLDEWVAINNNFNVIHTKNRGVSSARNTGLDLCKHEYITFCDSDDTLPDYFFENAINIMKKYNTDMAIGSCKFIYDDKEEIYSSNIDYLYNENNINSLFQYIIVGRPKKNDEILNNILASRTVVKMYKRELLKDIHFDNDLIMHEDTLFSINVMKKCKKVYITKDIWYNYFQNNYSITHAKANDRLLNQEILFGNKLCAMKDYFVTNNLFESYKLRMFYIMICYFQLLKYKKNRLNDINKILDLSSFKCVTKIKLNEYKNINLKDKIFALFFNIESEKFKKVLLNILLSLLHIIKK